jgi:hypothetical protein
VVIRSDEQNPDEFEVAGLKLKLIHVTGASLKVVTNDDDETFVASAFDLDAADGPTLHMNYRFRSIFGKNDLDPFGRANRDALRKAVIPMRNRRS